MLMWKRKETRRTQAVLMLVTGLALAGTVGKLRSWLEVQWTHAGSTVSDKLLGVAVPYVFALVIVIWFILDMDLDGLANKMRKRTGAANRHKATVVTPWLALLVPVAVASLPFVGGLPHTVTTALAS